MELKRRLAYEIQGSPLKQKALALAICVKLHIDISSAIPNFSINKLHTITGLSPNTIKKFLPIMEELGFVSYQGKDNNVLVVHRLCSKKKHRNITIDRIKTGSFKQIYNSLRSFIFLFIQANKDSIKRLFQSISNPKSMKELRSAKRTCKHLAALNIVFGNEYQEYGLSLRKIASSIGCCVKTAQKVVDFAIKNKWAKKNNHYKKDYMPNVCYTNIDGYTFTTLNHGYKVYANTYELSKPIATSLKPLVIYSW